MRITLKRPAEEVPRKKRPTEVTQSKNKMPKGVQKTSEQNQCHLPSEAQFGLESAKSTPKLDQNVLNSVITCDNNSHTPKHSPTLANIFTDPSKVTNSVIQCDNNSHATQHSPTFANILTGQSSVPNSVILGDNNSQAPQHSPTFANTFTDQFNIMNSVMQCDNNSHAPQHSPTFANILTGQSSVPNSVIEGVKFTDIRQHFY